MIGFTISTDTAIERGIVGRSELPELLHFFMSAARGHAARTFRKAGGLMIAERDNRFVTLSVSFTEQAIPSRCIFESIEDAMANTFINGESDAHRLSEAKGLPEWPTFFYHD